MSLSGKKHSLNSWMFMPAFREEGKDIGSVFRKLPEAGVGWAMGPSDTCTKYVIREGHRLRLSRKAVRGLRDGSVVQKRPRGWEGRPWV